MMNYKPRRTLNYESGTNVHKKTHFSNCGGKKFKKVLAVSKNVCIFAPAFEKEVL